MLVANLLSWWYGEGLKKKLGRLELGLVRLLDFFSIGILVRTLFTPFRLIDSYSPRGESLDAKMRAAIDQMIGRMIGAMIRLTVLVFGSIVIFTTIILAIVKMFLWLAAPFLPVLGMVLLALEFSL